MAPLDSEFESETRDVVPLDNLNDPTLSEGLAYWRGLRGERKFPSRTDVTMRGLGKLLSNTVLIRVLEGGKDYEFRIVGNAAVQAHGISAQGFLLSELCQAQNPVAIKRKVYYDTVAHNGTPIAVSGMIVPDGRKGERMLNSAIILPLGDNAAVVDFLLVFTVFSGRTVDLSAQW
jgi:hypothetical protein